MNNPKIVARFLTPRQKAAVMIGGITGSFSMLLVRNLKDKGLMHLVIDSPNGQCGFMRLTELGEQVQAILKARSKS